MGVQPIAGRGVPRRLAIVTGLSGALVACAGGAAAATSASIHEIEVIAPTPLPGLAIERDKLPVTVETVTDQDFAGAGSLAITDALLQRSPGVSLADSQGDPFTQDLDFRGAEASPLQGAPQGLAVYMNGVRLNEAFGDTVNWDLIPAAAIGRADIFAGNSTFGLNALGGSVSLRMKSGLTWTGRRLSLQGGSFGQTFGSAEYGVSDGAWGVYAAVDGGREDGWRQRSAARIARLFTDFGWKGEGAELHLFASGASNRLGGVGPAPVDLLARDRTAVYTSPQTTRNLAGLLGLSGEVELPRSWSVQALAYLRGFDQHHLDGNGGAFGGCPFDAGELCVSSDDFPAGLQPAPTAFQALGPGGTPIPCPTGGGGWLSCDQVPYGTLDRTSIHARTLGASLQATSRGRLLGRPNAFALGASLDRSRVRFASDSTLGVIGADLSIGSDPAVPGSGSLVATRGQVGYSPIRLNTSSAYYGVYVTDTWDLTGRLSITGGGRLNVAMVGMRDLTGSSQRLDGQHTFSRFDPSLGATYRWTPALTAYADYSEANRAPTPLELGCSDRLDPCLLENALVSDPPLRQVVARTWEAGLRGSPRLAGGRLTWRISLFQTALSNDILALASPIQGRGYYANVPGERRRGVEASLAFRASQGQAYVGFSHVDATYRFSADLPSPNNPSADANGDIQVRAGDRIGGVPQNRFKAGGSVSVTSRLTLGADIVAVGNQPLVGDEANQNPELPGYWTADLSAAYELPDRLELFARIDNLFDRRFAAYGTYFAADGVGKVPPPVLPQAPDPRTLTPAAPRAFTIGLRRSW